MWDNVVVTNVLHDDVCIFHFARCTPDVCVFSRLAQTSISSCVTIVSYLLSFATNICIHVDLKQHYRVQKGSEEGSIGATGVFATSLGTDVHSSQTEANTLESANPSPTGVPIISTDAQQLPTVEGSVPSTPATLRQD